jgi:subtilisin family serine protease
MLISPDRIVIITSDFFASEWAGKEESMANGEGTNSPDDSADKDERGEFKSDRLSRVTAPPELDDNDNRRRWRLGKSPEERGPYMIELNVQYMDGLAGAAHGFMALFDKVFGTETEPKAADRPPSPVKISKSYFRCMLNVLEWRHLVAADETKAREDAEKKAPGKSVDQFRYRIIYKVWPDFPVKATINRSVATIKADAALRSFEATGESITWAVIDSGVEASHPHFGAGDDHALHDPWVQNLHRCFVPINGLLPADPDEETSDQKALSEDERNRRIEQHVQLALADQLGHGTHVAGIITGRVPRDTKTVVLEKEEQIKPGDEQDNRPKRVRVTKERVISSQREKERFHGVAPGCRIVSLRVLDGSGEGRSSNIVRALEYIREKLNDNPKLLRVHGVNLSVGYEFDAEMFACGQSPLCSEVNRLVQSGVVVVTAAGNTGYTALTANNRVTKVGLSNTINDPGNAEHAITVGATHRESPHTFGVSYFSSKGPTGDGRLKPDLVAPGERIVSCAAGTKKNNALKEREPAVSAAARPDAIPAPAAPSAEGPGADAAPQPEPAYYVEDSGTSMAAPHVSGAIAAFLSIRREFIGRPIDVKRIFLESAIPLGRERYFEGHGLVDLMKAIQSV